MATKTKRNPNFAREIARRNRAFKAASPAGKRVMIAQDVLAQVKSKRFQPRTGTWAIPLTARGDILDVYMEFEEDESVRELFLKKKISSCECCALGAMFMSCTLYNNKTTVIDFLNETDFDFDERVTSGTFSNGLHKFFTRNQLKLIESAFEGDSGAFNIGNEKTSAWYKRLPDSKKRLVAIMENIIKNKGEFKP